MNDSTKFIIFFLFSLHILCMPKMSNSAQCCDPITCVRKSSSNNGSSISISFPFRVKDRQPESCGSPGFDMYCDNELGPLLELPKAGNFTVGSIYYYSGLKEIELSDANDCLPRKLLNLDLIATPFRVINQSQDFKVYNCSKFGDFYPLYVEKIDCLSGSNYTVISAGSSAIVNDSNCRFLKNVFVPSYPEYHRIYGELNSYSSIYLTWDDDQMCTLRGSNRRIWIATVTVVVCIVIGVSCVWFIQLSTRNDAQQQAAAVTTTNTNNIVFHGRSSTASDDVPTPLDATTINSYPMVVIGKSGRMIKTHDDKCPICLADYFPGDTLKIIPECLHRFHADCIDLWLGAKPTCPICRISPSHNYS